MSFQCVEVLNVGIERCLKEPRDRSAHFLTRQHVIMIWHQAICDQGHMVSNGVFPNQFNALLIMHSFAKDRGSVSPSIVNMVYMLVSVVWHDLAIAPFQGHLVAMVP